MKDDDLYGMFEGVVVERVDPEKRGGVRVYIDARTPPEGIWAYPFGGPGGGEKNRGFKFTPEVGAEVAVFFVEGNIDRARYTAGVWGLPGGVSDIPQSAQTDAITGDDIPAKEVPNVHVIESRRWEIVLDDREGHEKLLIRDKLSPARELGDDEFGTPGDFIEFDAREGHGDLIIRSTRSIVLKSEGGITLDAQSVIINGRLVTPTSKAIT